LGVEWIQTDRENSDFTALCQMLNQELVLKLSGSVDPISSRADKTDDFEMVLLAKADHVPVACAALRPFSSDTAELKRMFVLPAWRNKGIGNTLLGKCEELARHHNYRFLVLETNILLPDARSLYEKNGYVKRASYGPFAILQETLCMQKSLW
jgi:GNAT superfamily N-acetyltransferase